MTQTQIPSKAQILEWVSDNPDANSKRDIAKAFGIKGAARIDLKRLLRELEDEGAVFDMEPHRYAPPGLRLWCGCTVETADVVDATPWLEWAFATAVSELSA